MPSSSAKDRSAVVGRDSPSAHRRPVVTSTRNAKGFPVADLHHLDQFWSLTLRCAEHINRPDAGSSHSDVDIDMQSSETDLRCFSAGATPRLSGWFGLMSGLH